MPFRFEITEDRALACGYGWGTIAHTDIIDALEHAFVSHRYRPGIDRISVADPGARVSGIDLTALRELQAYVLKRETETAAAPAFRSALVGTDPAHSGVMSLYKALWSEPRFDRVQIGLFTDTADALRWLGRPADMALPLEPV